MVQNATNGLVMSKEPCVSSIFFIVVGRIFLRQVALHNNIRYAPLEHYQAAAHILEGGIFFHGNRASNR